MYNLLKRFYIEAPITPNTLKSNDKELIHYITNVLRLGSGSKLLVFNQDSGEFLAKIEAVTKSEIFLQIETKTKEPEKQKNISIAFSPIKHERLKFMVEKCTEIGCTNFIPVITERTIVRTINHAKLSSYVISASEQSGRCTVPTFENEISLQVFLKRNTSILIFCDEQNHNNFIGNISLAPENITILIGPEGGFTNKERDLLLSSEKVYSVSLGPNILRSETAAVFALSSMLSKS